MYSPTLDEFLKLAAQGNLIPVTRRLLADLRAGGLGNESESAATGFAKPLALR